MFSTVFSFLHFLNFKIEFRNLLYFPVEIFVYQRLNTLLSVQKYYQHALHQPFRLFTNNTNGSYFDMLYYLYIITL